MAELVLHDVDEETVRKLKLRAADHGVSQEEELRRILNMALRYFVGEPFAEPIYKRVEDPLTEGPRIPAEYQHFFAREDEDPQDSDFA